MTKSPTPETPSTPSVSPDASSPDKTRRTLAGLGASAIFTLASRPVLAVTCNSPSAAASGNLSFHGTPPNCTGQTPAQWVALLSVSDSRNVTFHAPPPPARNGVFKTGIRADWNNSKLRTVMSTASNGNTTSTPNPISAEFAATLLNIRAGYIPAGVLTEMDLIEMWNEWMDTGGFVPTAGATPWEASQIVTYLQSLQGA